MNIERPDEARERMLKLGKAAAALGFEIVDIAGFLDLVDEHARQQGDALVALRQSAAETVAANADALTLVSALGQTADQSLRDVQASSELLRFVGEKTQNVAGWVTSVRDRTDDVGETLLAVKANNSQIAAIATQVNTLAINAKIEAARAGEAGRGFAVVADAINDLSKKTGLAARQISENIENLTDWISQLGCEAEDVAEAASLVLDRSSETDRALSRMEDTIETEHEQVRRIAAQAERVSSAMEKLKPAVLQIDESVQDTNQGIDSTNARMNNLIDHSERIVQLTASLGADSDDASFIDFVRRTAKEISIGLEQAVATGRISLSDLFDQTYIPLPGTDPQQVVTRATDFLDIFLPEHQEPALEIDNRVIFCAAVDRNGYLPTHNKKFSLPQGKDPVWNTAHCRNRRIFDDRVGLKAGRSTAPFLLQVYRRDMGGGEFRVMKDLSAPIRVEGRHWGGLRLAYGY
ncbi:MAG: methyl-accepting chemotaxis protein [Sulfitobacter sp.]|nr:methyl-accepting chemotaxis protein [Sulfitobacter sp.]